MKNNSTKRKNKARKPRKPPRKFKTGFLEKLDRRTENFQALNQTYESVIADKGGKDNLSKIELCLIERFCFLEFSLRAIEYKMTTGGANGETAELLGKWIHATNSLIGLSRTLGLERRAKTISGDLQSYINSQKSG
jgi:hypothetical protein